MQIIIYSKSPCVYCDKAKALLKKLDLEFIEYKMNIDISRDDLLEKFPEAKTMPIIVIDNCWIGGYTELEKLLNGKNAGKNGAEKSL